MLGLRISVGVRLGDIGEFRAEEFQVLFMLYNMISLAAVLSWTVGGQERRQESGPLLSER